MIDATRVRGLTLLVAAMAAMTGVSLRAVAAPALAVDPKLYAELTWQCTGPFDGGPVASVTGVTGVPGTYTLTTPTGSAWKTVDGGGSWTPIASAAGTMASADPRRWVDPSNPRRVVRTDDKGIEVSLDGGQTWVASHHLPIADVEHLPAHERAAEAPNPARTIAGKPVNVSIADAAKPGLVFAGTNTGVFVSFDAGADWSPLRQNMPAVAITDLDIRGHDLIAATRGRSIWTLPDITPLRQITDTTASASAMLFKPAEADQPGSVFIDYHIGVAARAVSIDITDASGRVIRTWKSIAGSTDQWLPVTRPLETTAGEHRIAWTLRYDAPPSPHHRFAPLARPLFETRPPDPDGPRVLPGTYRVRLTIGGQAFTQPLVVRGAAGTTATADERARFDLEMKAYEAMRAAHRGFLQLQALRDRVKPLLSATDPDLALAATDLDTKLAGIDGSDWTGLVIPDADEDNQAELDEEAKEGKHPDFVPPKAVSLSKDYDDPTSVLGRSFTNVDPPPAFAIVGTRLGELVARVDRAPGAPDPLATDNYDVSCQRLASVLDTWRAINAADVPHLNLELSKRRLAPLPVASPIPTIACAAKRP